MVGAARKIIERRPMSGKIGGNIVRPYVAETWSAVYDCCPATEIVPAVRYGRIDCPFINGLGYRYLSGKGGKMKRLEESSRRKRECSRGKTICRDKN